MMKSLGQEGESEVVGELERVRGRERSRPADRAERLRHQFERLVHQFAKVVHQFAKVVHQFAKHDHFMPTREIRQHVRALARNRPEGWKL